MASRRSSRSWPPPIESRLTGIHDRKLVPPPVEPPASSPVGKTVCLWPSLHLLTQWSLRESGAVQVPSNAAISLTDPPSSPPPTHREVAGHVKPPSTLSKAGARLSHDQFGLGYCGRRRQLDIRWIARYSVYAQRFPDLTGCAPSLRALPSKSLGERPRPSVRGRFVLEAQWRGCQPWSCTMKRLPHLSVPDC